MKAKRILCSLLATTIVSSSVVSITPVSSSVFASETSKSATVSASTVTPKLSVKTKTLNKGEKYTLKVTNTTKKVTWKSSNTKVATVTAKGVVTAKKTGTANITATVNGKKATCKVTVKVLTPKLNTTKVSLEKGKTYTLKITNFTNTAKWTSSNTKVATVTSKGVITAKSAGTATITATVNGKKATCKVTVNESTPKLSINVSYHTDYKNGRSSVTLNITNNDTVPIYLGEYVYAHHVDVYGEYGLSVKDGTLGFHPYDDGLDLVTFAKYKNEDTRYGKYEKGEYIPATFTSAYTDPDLAKYKHYCVFDRSKSLLDFSIIKNNTLYRYEYDFLLDSVKLLSQYTLD